MTQISTLGGQGWIELVQHMGNELTIVNAAKIAYNGHADIVLDKERALLRSLLSNGHTSPLEHVVFTFRVFAPIFVARQWMRHRTWSYSELSRRFSKGAPEFYQPDAQTGNEDYKQAVIKASTAYLDMLKDGVKAEVARMVLPVCLMTEFYGTVNLNNLIKFLKLRDDPHAQAEIREYAKAIKKLISPLLPNVAEACGWTEGGEA